MVDSVTNVAERLTLSTWAGRSQASITQIEIHCWYHLGVWVQLEVYKDMQFRNLYYVLPQAHQLLLRWDSYGHR